MDVILNELHKNGILIDIDTLKHYLKTIKEDHEFIYNAIVHSCDLRELFYEMEVNNLGRALTYLTYVYVSNRSEEDIRRAVQLVAVPLKRCVLENTKSY